MSAQSESPAEEVKRLRRCINDLISVLALPAGWTGGEPARIVNNLLDALLSMLNLDFVYVRLPQAADAPPAEMARSTAAVASLNSAVSGSGSSVSVMLTVAGSS